VRSNFSTTTPPVVLDSGLSKLNVAGNASNNSWACLSDTFKSVYPLAVLEFSMST
jgi:hypothetical protein